MEEWSFGVMKLTNPALHYSITPLDCRHHYPVPPHYAHTSP